jgi:hypothetical protein
VAGRRGLEVRGASAECVRGLLLGEARRGAVAARVSMRSSIASCARVA